MEYCMEYGCYALYSTTLENFAFAFCTIATKAFCFSTAVSQAFLYGGHSGSEGARMAERKGGGGGGGGGGCRLLHCKLRLGCALCINVESRRFITG